LQNESDPFKVSVFKMAQMKQKFIHDVQQFDRILDFLRLAVSQAGREQLYYGHGTDNAWDDLLTLVAETLSFPTAILGTLLQAHLTATEKEMLAKQLARRIFDRIPVPYLTQQAHFCGLSFYVDERVLIPRSPIAELIEQQFSPWIEAHQVTRILDMCTGSACIAIACCYAFPEAAVDAVDYSAAALVVAEINRQRHDAVDQLSLIESDCFTAVPDTQYDIIVSNPPYVGEDSMALLPTEYRHEPVMALHAENNGLAIVETLLRNASRYLSDVGILVVEVGESEEALMAAYPDVPFIWLSFERGGSGVFLLTKAELDRYF
jgi:ribosomal protein L3 glutamine methyltransferase